MNNNSNSIIYKMKVIFPALYILAPNQIKRLTSNFKFEKNNLYSFIKKNHNYNIIIDFKDVHIFTTIQKKLINTIISIIENIQKENIHIHNITILNSNIDDDFNKKIQESINNKDNLIFNTDADDDLLRDIDKLLGTLKND